MSAVEHARLVFLGIGFANIILVSAYGVANPSGAVPTWTGLVSAVGVAALWVFCVRKRAVPPWAAAVEPAMLLLMTIMGDDPRAGIALAQCSISLGAQYGSNRSLLARVGGNIALPLVAFSIVDRGTDPLSEVAAWLVPSLIFTAAVMRIIAVSLRRVTAGREVSESLARTAGGLLAAEDTRSVALLTEAGARAVVPDAQQVMVQTGDDPPDPPVEPSGVTIAFSRNGERYGWLHVAAQGRLSLTSRQALETLAAHATSALRAVALRMQLNHQATHDSLTALPNRALFADVLVRNLTGPESRVGALFIDLDDFKGVNDTLGHDAGDTLLTEVARRLRGCIRPTDLAARLGGDEFAALVADAAGPEDVIGLAQRILAVLDEPVNLAGVAYRMRSSIGVALSEPSDEAPADRAATLLKQADVAMYLAKARGKNRFELYTDSIGEAIERDAPVGRADTSTAVAGRLPAPIVT